MSKMLALLVLTSLTGLLACAQSSTDTLSPMMPSTKTAPGVPEAWEQQWTDTLAGARRENQLVMYTTLPPEIRGIFSNGVKGKYGIDMEFVVGRSAELNTKILSERRAGLYIGDVLITGISDLISILIPAKVLDPIERELILPEVTDPKYWYNNKLPFVDSEKRLFGFRGGPQRFITINTDLVDPGDMSSYKDLLNPKFKGRIAMADPTVAGTASTFLTALGEYFTGYDFIRELPKQGLFISRDQRLLMEGVARGKYPILIGVSADAIAEFESAGAPVLSVLPEEGSIINPGVGTLAVINQRPHSNATMIFVNWLLSKEGQTLYAEAARAESARVDVSKAHLDTKMIRESGKKHILTDEQFYKTAAKNIDGLFKEIFGPLLK